MSNQLFFHHFPEVAKAETRTINLLPGRPGELPAGAYALVESYCTDPACDCRRVLLHVLKEPEGILAVISFAFDPDDPMRGPFLDPINPQGPHAQELLRLVNDLCLRDPVYLARLERHYRMMKDTFGRPGAGGTAKPAREERWWKKKRTKPRRFRPGPGH